MSWSLLFGHMQIFKLIKALSLKYYHHYYNYFVRIVIINLSVFGFIPFIINILISVLDEFATHLKGSFFSFFSELFIGFCKML